jgi:hypothetical protein
MSDRPLSERVRMIFGATGTVMDLEQAADEIAALEAERSQPCGHSQRLAYAADEGTCFCTECERIAKLEADYMTLLKERNEIAAERDRLQAQLDECESFKSPSNPLLRAALEEGGDDE